MWYKSRDRLIKPFTNRLGMGFPYPYPLGLPKGSVRATLTLLLSTDLFLITIREEPFADQVASIVLVALAFYFGGRMRARGMVIPRDTSTRADRAWGLPSGTIRTILIIFFIFQVLYLQYIGISIPDYYIDIATIIFGFLFGRTFNRFKVAFRRRRGVEEERLNKTSLIEHLNAVAAIAIVGFTFYVTAFNPTFQFLEQWIAAAAIYLGFYYGERA